ncbi:MAG: hypothetical protein RSB13_03845 [Aurantimicrobium sp.]|uniref:plasmid mobilization protein n=1 Tax=Aurantimicrobium sp. TaxID=1930784 RepID=UPI002FC5D642
MSDATAQAAPANRPRKRDVRFSEAEHALVERSAASYGLTPSAFVRGAAVDAAREQQGLPPERRGQAAGATPPQLTADAVAVLGALRTEVKRVGVNLNQQTRLAHHGVIDLRQVGPTVEEVAALCEQVVALLGGSSKGVAS